MSNNTERLDDQELNAWHNLMSAHAGLSSGVDRELNAEHDLGIADFEVLSHLYESSDRSQRMTELARGVLLSPSGLTRRLDGLVRSGYVERQPCPSDGRGLLAVLTDKGGEKVEQMGPTYSGAVRKCFVDRLGPGQLSQLIAILGPLNQSLISSAPQGLAATTRQPGAAQGEAQYTDVSLREEREPAGI